MKRFNLIFILAFIILISCSESTEPQNDINIEPNEYGLKVITKTSDYLKTIQFDSNNKLINLKEYIPDIVLDVRYATTNNFTKQKVYDTNLMYLRLPAAKALKEIQQELKIKNLGLKIFDAYRPYSITKKFYEIYKDTNFVAAPWYGSRHNRACAVDLSIIDLSTGQEIPMPTEYDDFTEKAHPNYPNLPDSIKTNREILKNIMSKYNFSVYPSEWWHYDFKGWENYYLMDINFRDL